MRAVGMLRTGFILVFLIIAYASTLPLQFLPPIPGYVPVYIRNGDEPLEAINLALAEAFAEHSSPKNLEASNVALEVRQPVDYEEDVNGHEDGAKSTKYDVFVADEGVVEKNGAATPVQRRSSPQKKSQAVTLEVNRSRIPQLLTAQEREDEQTEILKPDPISLTLPKEATIQESNAATISEEKLTSDVEKSEFKPNEVVDPNPNYPELPAEIPQQHNSQDFGSPSDVHQDIGSPVTSHQLHEAHRDEWKSDESLSDSSESEESVELQNDTSSSTNFETNESE